MDIQATITAISTVLAAWVDWLGIKIEIQDLIKAGMLTAFVLGILMIIGDIYRGEIQNAVHRVKLVSRDGTLPVGLRRRRKSEASRAAEVPPKLIPSTLQGVHSHIYVLFAYRDCLGKRRVQKLEKFDIVFKVRRSAFPFTTLTKFPDDHKHRFNFDGSLEESDEPIQEPDILSLAASRVDLVSEARKTIFEREQRKAQTLKNSRVARWRVGMILSQVKEPVEEGILAKFHFPIDPYFLLYKHPDREIKSTAWLTVLTSVFAVAMQLIYGHGS